MKQTRLLPATDGPAKSVQHILLFDDHPDSLRLIFDRPANWDPVAPRERASIREFILPGVVVLVGLIAMCWPLL